MPSISTVDAFLGHVGLDHLAQQLSSATLEELAYLAAEAKTKCLNRLKELGVEKLPERQKFANGMLKALREGLVEDVYKAEKEAKDAEEAKRKEETNKTVKEDAFGQRVQTEDDGFDLAVALLQGVKTGTYGAAGDDPVEVYLDANTSVGYKAAYEQLRILYELPDDMRPPLAELGEPDRSVSYTTAVRRPRAVKRAAARKPRTKALPAAEAAGETLAAQIGDTP